jgi:hypothetical protein
LWVELAITERGTARGSQRRCRRSPTGRLLPKGCGSAYGRRVRELRISLPGRCGCRGPFGTTRRALGMGGFARMGRQGPRSAPVQGQSDRDPYAVHRPDRDPHSVHTSRPDISRLNTPVNAHRIGIAINCAWNRDRDQRRPTTDPLEANIQGPGGDAVWSRGGTSAAPLYRVRLRGSARAVDGHGTARESTRLSGDHADRSRPRSGTAPGHQATRPPGHQATERIRASGRQGAGAPGRRGAARNVRGGRSGGRRPAVLRHAAGVHSSHGL